MLGATLPTRTIHLLMQTPLSHNTHEVSLLLFQAMRKTLKCREVIT